MQEVNSVTSFFSNDAAGVIKVLITVVGPIILSIGGFFWALTKADFNRKIEKVDEQRKQDFNGLGERLNEQRNEIVKQGTIIESLTKWQERAITETNSMRERVSASEKSIDSIREEVRDDRIALMTTLHNNEKAASERDSALREQLARMEERMNIERIVKTVVREFKDG